MAYYIEEFQGTFKAEKQTANTSNGDKSTYYPGPEVQIKLFVEEHRSMRALNPVTIKVIRGKVTKGKKLWKGAESFEKARFYFHAGILVSDPIETSFENPIGTPLFVTEAIMLLNDGSMEHQLSWSDGDFGRWGCR